MKARRSKLLNYERLLFFCLNEYVHYFFTDAYTNNANGKTEKDTSQDTDRAFAR